MSVTTYDVAEEVDLSKLIHFGMTFEPLQLTLRDILRRLAQQERHNTTQDDRIAQLSANVDDLEAANKALAAKLAKREAAGDGKRHPTAEHTEAAAAEAAAAESGNQGFDSEAIWDEIARLNSVLGELQEGAERDRHTIDEIYAVRKRRQSQGATAVAAAKEEGELQKEAEEGAKTGQADRRVSTGVDAQTPPPARTQSATRPVSGEEDATAAATKPVGDVILAKAHESLVFDSPKVYTVFEETAPITGQQPLASREGSAAAGGEPYVQLARPLSGSAAFSASPSSRPTSHAHRRSVYADQRIAAATARRASQASGGLASEAASRNESVFDKLKRDGDDIAYLNRVVAEILGEMKGLHADVDQLRTSQAEETDEEEGAADSKTSGAGASAADLSEMRRRLARVERDAVDTRQRLEHRDDSLQEELDELKKQLRVARALTDDDLDAVRNVRDLADRLKKLEERVRLLEAAHGALAGQFEGVLAIGDKGEGGAADINPVQFAALQGAVKNAEKQLTDLLAAQDGQQDWSEQIRKLNDAVRAVERDAEVARDELQRALRETARLDEVKANKSDPSLSLLSQKRHSSADGNALADLVSRVARAETSIDRLNEDKADRSALQKLRDELNALRQLAELTSAQLRDGDGSSAARSSAAMEKLLRELQVDVSALKDAQESGNLLRNGGGVGDDMDDLKDRVERLDHCKADATLVANKAERDYVENALERLMREVEQVLNATNAGLIDTLEKSLNILRDMIDGKATKQDVANLQGWMAETNGAGGLGAGAADGLTGFKGFRCLGCNRPMDSMRPRTLPATMTPFLNRNPQNFPQDNVTRTIQQQQQQQPQRVVGSASSFTAGVRNAGAPGSTDANLHRSTSSEPLPPIEQS
ncbi:hypothetical protein ABB37_07217 [Leptomonas pyrrhocoris]|uniref:Uncharacterized protein n=1 Tax=Leptomonas pyrrhocoris TaxID=157538 RepID=A0A0M9FW75_LEPPY|nr:hypothetical protein ABB37_07217 [Leptomonas pyrrhocoris]XP_015655773.1 hypothetical protein ABB37_07217 [Leptomonas pyrrhocoris]XP_015655774.1 hypothetical protein ABB37_07217 [Leptomonas pyrrhocoris]KPA77333.1 hypothetical protein ABB37_07217 [Leptomonas pyrrhocoris]KPA77334.1 hypothetical protein ABB37_07217 [Leptomonas pyrrhocoris]KPA77335.1 hypothetical protein ABB37_07217 [Leptomonas pyrrhocoris]|eukprot:XP_015655772.1 hypothetical protein ABB37_07217 [Leptomonas pyrrhocoris]